MSQNDLSIANQGFASFRSDLNSALQALGSTNSGTSAPSTTYANQLFYDTTNNILKIRNEDNDAFISLFTLDQTNDLISGFTSPITITTADNNPQLTLTSTDADANRGAVLHLVRNSASPADNDFCGSIMGIAKNSAGEDVTLVDIIFRNEDVTDGTEDGQIIVNCIRNGSQTGIMKMSASETIMNYDATDIDFRVASNNNANMLFVDAGNDKVQIGSSLGSATGNGLEITNTNGDAGLVLFRDFSGSNVSSETSSNKINFVLQDSAQKETIASIAPMANAGNSDRLTGIIRLMASDGDGNLDELMRTRDPAFGGTMIGKTSTSASVAGFQIRTGITGGNNIVQNSTVVLKVNRQSDDGELIAFLQANNQEGSISVSGGTVSYNTFSGSHWSRLSDNSKPTILKGTVIETIDEMCDWYQAEFTLEEATEDTPEIKEKISIALPKGKSVGDKISITHEGITYKDAKILKENDDKHPKCKISDTADSNKVYGVYTAWDNDDDAINDMYVTAVGTHVVRVNKDVTVQAGDLLSSNGDGTAKVQDDDVIRSKTIGKVLTNIKQETYSDGSYTVPCALYCG